MKYILKFPLLNSFAVLLLSFLLFYSFLVPTWQTNDDVGMSMQAHGYGACVLTTPPNLIFSNHIWGEIVNKIPSFFGILGYSWGTVFVLFFAAWSFWLLMIKNGTGYILSYMLVLLIFEYPLIQPQFTMNAGLITASSLFFLMKYGNNKNIFYILSFALLAFFGFLIRLEEFALVIIVALPLIPWKTLVIDKKFISIFIILAVCIVFSWRMEKNYSSTPEWEAFNSLNPYRVMLTDYKADELLLERPNLLSKYRYSKNDIYLFKSWFFTDQKLANPKRMGPLFNELLKDTSKQQFNFHEGFTAIPFLLKNKELQILLFIGLSLGLFLKQKRIFIAYSILFFVIFTFGVLGRPGIIRVYYPVFSLLAAIPLINKKKLPDNLFVYLLTIGIFLCGIYFNSFAVLKMSDSNKKMIPQLTKDVNKISKADMFFVWGARFPYELFFNFFQNDKKIRESLSIYGIDSNSYAPNSRSMIAENSGNGFVSHLLSKKGASFIGWKDDVLPKKLLEVYCTEHFNGSLNIQNIKSYQHLQTLNARCIVHQELSQN